MPLTGDVGQHLHLIGQPHLGYLPQRRVGFLGGGCLNVNTNPPLLRRAFPQRALVLQSVVKVFFDDDLRMAFGHGRVRWGDTAGGCFCDVCVAEFNRRNATRFTRADLREIVMNPGRNPEVLEDWITFNCDKVTDFMKAVNLPGIQVGIMVMCMGSRNHGIDLAAIQKAVPDCLVRVGEGHFNDASFDPPEGKAAEIESIRLHMAQVGDVTRLYSENTVDPWPKLRPENMAKKLLIEVENGLRNIMLMPPPLIDAPEYWEAIAAALPEAKDICRRAK